MGAGPMTDSKFAVVQSFGGIRVDTYRTRREMVDDQVRMLFVDVFYHSGRTPEHDEKHLQALQADLRAYVDQILEQVKQDWNLPASDEDDDEQEAPQTEVADQSKIIDQIS